MKKLIALLTVVTMLSACDDSTPEQKKIAEQQKQIEQLQQQQAVLPQQAGQPVIINQAPAQPADSGVMPFIGGALLGHALTNTGGSRNNTHTITRTRVIEKPVYRPAPSLYKPKPRIAFSKPSTFRSRR